jgi:DNA-binding MarR family transcriptional regulator/N-acetylglutamate synthase-like GNAT family acetyltransferase
MDKSGVEQRVARIRRFNRFYTRQIGALNEGLLNSPFSLTEARVLYELAHAEHTTARALAQELSIDPGYLSRILRAFKERGLVAGEASEDDARVRDLRLTKAGRRAFAPLDKASRDDVAAMLGALAEPEQGRLIAAIDTIETLLGARKAEQAPYLIRPHRPGDMGWIVHRHAALYVQEYGWDGQFEAMVAEIAAQFIKNFDPNYERCWIAERDGETIGSVLCVKQSDAVAKLRLLLVEPRARGLGVGARLVEECIRFARASGYRTLTLWTNDILVAARHIYVAAGFKLVAEEKHHSFGKDLVGQNWELALSADALSARSADRR